MTAAWESVFIDGFEMKIYVDLRSATTMISSIIVEKRIEELL